ncbi:MAG TPA: sulfurtransferase [Acidobacteriota bacterium]
MKPLTRKRAITAAATAIAVIGLIIFVHESAAVGTATTAVGVAATSAATASDAGESAGGQPVTRATQTGEVPVLVSTDWVAAHREDPGVLLVHVAMLEMAPPAAFIPGAVALDYHAIETSEGGVAVELPPVEQLATIFRRAGIGGATHVVLYGPAPAHLAARAFVTLEYLGHGRLSVMDGGIEAWQAEGRPTVPRPAEPAAGSFVPQVRADIVVDADWIAARLDDASIVPLDARPADQFSSTRGRGSLRPGHIPGAGNLYFVELLESEDMPRLKPRAEVEALFAAAGAGAGKTVVSYCQIGMRASYNYLIARHLGYDVKFYDGSWADWGARSDLPVETGPRR